MDNTDEATIVTGSSFLDITSQKELSISAEGDATVTLRPVNVAIFSDYYHETLTTNAVLVVKDDHTISPWGPAYSYVSIPDEKNHKNGLQKAFCDEKYSHLFFIAKI